MSSTFLGHIVPVAMPYEINGCYEFARQQGWIVQTILQGIVSPGKFAGPNARPVPAWLVYYSAADDDFFNFFQEKYQVQNSARYPEMIKEHLEKKENQIS